MQTVLFSHIYRELYMKQLINLTTLMSILLVTGCMSHNFYTDEQYKLAKEEQLRQPKKPIEVIIDAELLRNGEVLPEGKKETQLNFEKAFSNTKIVKPVENSRYKLKATFNNIAERGKAVASGALTGFTFGTVGSTVTDNYEFTCRYFDSLKEKSSKVYKHKLVSTINDDAPIGKYQHHQNVIHAVDQIVSDLAINCLYDLQNQGYLK